MIYDTGKREQSVREGLWDRLMYGVTAQRKKYTFSKNLTQRTSEAHLNVAATRTLAIEKQLKHLYDIYHLFIIPHTFYYIIRNSKLIPKHLMNYFNISIMIIDTLQQYHGINIQFRFHTEAQITCTNVMSIQLIFLQLPSANLKSDQRNFSQIKRLRNDIGANRSRKRTDSIIRSVSWIIAVTAIRLQRVT